MSSEAAKRLMLMGEGGRFVYLLTVKCLNDSLNVDKLTAFDLLLNPVETHVTAHEQLHKANRRVYVVQSVAVN